MQLKLGKKKSFEQLKRGLRKCWAALTTEALADPPAFIKPLTLISKNARLKL